MLGKRKLDWDWVLGFGRKGDNIRGTEEGDGREKEVRGERERGRER